MVKAKEAEATASSQAPPPAQPAETPSAQSPKYCAVCIPLGKLCPNKYPVTSDWKDKCEEGEESQEQVKEENFSVCSDWDADLEAQE